VGQVPVSDQSPNAVNRRMPVDAAMERRVRRVVALDASGRIARKFTRIGVPVVDDPRKFRNGPGDCRMSNGRKRNEKWEKPSRPQL